MGWIATPALVAASCEAGAFGFLAGAVMSPAGVKTAIAQTRSLTNKPFGVNFHMFQPGAHEIADLLIDERVRAVSFGRGSSLAMIERFKTAGIICIPTVGALKHATKMAELGVDMLIVQGGEGGGHTGSVATSVLLPQVLDTVSIPVVAAGGFSDGRGLAGALAYGACGIAMGTRFLLTEESPVPEATIQKYLVATTDDIVVCTRIDGIPQRMIRSPLVARLERSGPLGMWVRAFEGALALKRRTGAPWIELLTNATAMAKSGETSWRATIMAAAAPALIQKAVVDGKPEEGVMPTGQVAGRLVDVPTCRDLVAQIVADARTRLLAVTALTSCNA